MLKRNERTCTVYFPVYGNYAANIVLTDDVAGSRVARNEEIGDVYDGAPANGLHSWSAKCPWEAWLFFWHKPSVGTVAHEAWHCIDRMFCRMGAGLDNETVAYHLGYLVNEIWAFVEKGQKHGVSKKTKSRRGTKASSRAARKHGRALQGNC